MVHKVSKAWVKDMNGACMEETKVKEKSGVIHDILPIPSIASSSSCGNSILMASCNPTSDLIDLRTIDNRMSEPTAKGTSGPLRMIGLDGVERIIEHH